VNHISRFFNDFQAVDPEFPAFRNEITENLKAGDLAREIKLGTPAGGAIFLAQINTRCVRGSEFCPLLGHRNRYIKSTTSQTKLPNRGQSTRIRAVLGDTIRHRTKNASQVIQAVFDIDQSGAILGQVWSGRDVPRPAQGLVGSEPDLPTVVLDGLQTSADVCQATPKNLLSHSSSPHRRLVLNGLCVHCMYCLYCLAAKIVALGHIRAALIECGP